MLLFSYIAEIYKRFGVFFYIFDMIINKRIEKVKNKNFTNTILFVAHIEHGTCYDSGLNIYTCPNCKIFKTNKNVLFFIYHLSKCKIDAQVRMIGFILQADEK